MSEYRNHSGDCVTFFKAELLQPVGGLVRSHCSLCECSLFSCSDSDTGAVQLMLNVQTAYSKPELLQSVVDRLVAEVPEVASIVNNVNESPGCGTVSLGCRKFYDYMLLLLESVRFHLAESSSL
jgi:hypothetical protein